MKKINRVWFEIAGYILWVVLMVIAAATNNAALILLLVVLALIALAIFY